MKSFSLKQAVLFVMLTFCYGITWAQDSTSSMSSSTTATTTTTQETLWYTNPWVWVIGGAVLILLLVALLRGGDKTGRTDSVTVKKSVTRDTDV